MVIGLTLLLLFTGAVMALFSRPQFQNWVLEQVRAEFSKQLKTQIEIKTIDLHLFQKAVLGGLLIRDQANDTLLYAQEMKINMGAFLLFRKQITLNTISLDRVYLNVYRKNADSVFNYQFIADKFQSNDTSRTQSQWNFPLRMIELQDVRIRYNDEHTALAELNLQHLKVDVQDFNLPQQRLSINTISIEKPQLNYLAYNTATSDTTSVFNQHSPAFSSNGWTLYLKNMEIEDASCQVTSHKNLQTAYFNPNDFAIQNLSVAINQFILQGDSLGGIVDGISFHESCGFDLSQFSTRFSFSNQMLTLDDLKIATPHSHLQSAISLTYANLNSFSNWHDDLRFSVQLKEAKVSPQDLDYFYPLSDQYPLQEIKLKGNIQGTLSNLKARELEFNYGQDNYLAGKVVLKGLPDLDNTFIEFTADQLNTNGNQLLLLIPTKDKPEELGRLGNILFRGSVTGFISDLVAHGEVATGLGNATYDINLKIGCVLKKLKFVGQLAIENLQRGRFLDEEKREGPITANASLEGHGWFNHNPYIKISGGFDQLYFNDYNYHDLKLDGSFDQKLFKGNFSSTDDNFNIQFTGLADFNDSIPRFNFTSTAKHIALKTVNLTQEPYIFSGNFSLIGSGNTIDNFQGTADLRNAIIKLQDGSCTLDSFVCESHKVGRQKLFTVKSDVMEADVNGDFTYEGLPKALQKMANNVFPSYIPLVDNSESSGLIQDFQFTILIKEPYQLTQLFLPKLESFDSARIAGKFNSATNYLTLNGDIPFVKYDQITLKNLAINAQSKGGLFYSEINCNTFGLTDSFRIHDSRLKLIAARDSLIYSFTAANDTGSRIANLAGMAYASPSSLKMQLSQSSLKIADKIWRINPDNEFVYEKNKLKIRDFGFQHDSQSVLFNTVSDSLNTYNLKVSIHQLSLPDLEETFYHSRNIKGTANAELVIIDALGDKLTPEGELKLNNFIYGADSIGDVVSTFTYQNNTKKLTTHLLVLHNENKLDANGVVDFNQQPGSLNIIADLQKFDLSSSEPFIKDVLSQKKGIATGKLTVTGTLNNPLINGSLQVENGATRITYLNTYYRFEKATVDFKDNLIIFNKLILRDTLNNPADVWGSIDIRNFKKVLLDLKIETQNLLVMNTNYEQNPLFFGTAYAAGNINLVGPTWALDIIANAKTMKGTHIYIPIDDDRDTKKHDFVTFINHSDTVVRKYVEDLDGIALNFDFDITKDAEVDLLMDLQAGDVLHAIGKGEIKIDYNTVSTFNMYGNYLISQGDYYFTFQNIFNKNFIIQPGSSITWNGSPYNALTDVTANYKLRTSVYELIKNDLLTTSDENSAALRSRVPINVGLKLSGALINPDISFDISAPDAGSTTQFYTQRKFDQLKADPAEMNNQIFGLLVLGKFLPTAGATSATTNNPFTSGVNNTWTEFASTQVSSRLNDIYSRFTKDPNTDFNVNYRVYDESSLEKTLRGQTVTANISRKFFNDRVNVDVGGNFDFGRTGSTGDATTANNNFAGDFQINYAITPDGRFKFKGFRKTEYDILKESNRNRTGIALSYNHQFDSFKELFNRKANIKSDQIK